MEPAPKILYSRKEASRLLSISLRSLDELIARGELRAIHKGQRKTLVHRSELERWAKIDSRRPMRRLRKTLPISPPEQQLRLA